MTTENMIKLLSANTDLRTMLNTSNTTATKRALKGMTEEELVGLCEQFGINLEETPTEGTTALSAVEGISVHTTPKGEQVAYLACEIVGLSGSGNTTVKFDRGTIIVNNSDLGYLVGKGIIVGSIPVKADTIKPIPTLPGYYEGQALTALIPQLLEMTAFRKQQKQDAKLLRKELRSVGLSNEIINQRLADDIIGNTPKAKRPY
jgi:hypothetical protein